MKNISDVMFNKMIGYINIPCSIKVDTVLPHARELNAQVRKKINTMSVYRYLREYEKYKI